MIEVKAALNSKELQMKSEGKEESDGEGLTVRERPQKKDNKNSRGKSRSKSKVGRKCFFCHKEGHYKKKCYERKNKLAKNNGDKGDVSVASNGYESLNVLVASINDSGNNGYWTLSVHFI